MKVVGLKCLEHISDEMCYENILRTVTMILLRIFLMDHTHRSLTEKDRDHTGNVPSISDSNEKEGLKPFSIHGLVEGLVLGEVSCCKFRSIPFLFLKFYTLPKHIYGDSYMVRCNKTHQLHKSNIKTQLFCS